MSTRAVLYSLLDYGCLSISQFKEYQKRNDVQLETSIFGDSWDGDLSKKTKGRDLISDRFQWLVSEALQKKKIDKELASRLLKTG